MAKASVIEQDSELPQLTASEILPILEDAAKKGISVGLEGPPGGGKSELVAQAAAAAGLPLYISNGELEDTTDGKGLPFRDAENPHQVVWLKDRKFLQPHPCAFFHDELPRSTVAVQGTKATLLLENRIDDLYLPKGTWHVWAGNRTTDRAGANRVPSIIYQRCDMYELVYCAEDLIAYMITLQDVDILTIRFLRMKGDAALQFDPAKKINPTPRSWTTVARKLFHDSYTPFATIAGRITKGFASELMAFRDLAPMLPSVEELLMSPEKARVPDNTSAQFLITDTLADHASVNTFDAIVTYLKRLPPEMQAKAIKDSLKRAPEVASTKSFVTWGVKFADVLR